MPESLDKKEDREIMVNLQKLGLTDKQASVYVALVHLGEVGSSSIIKKTALHGQFVYQALENLEERGLVQHVIKRGRKKFSVKSPYTLVRLIEAQKNIASSLAGDLVNMMTRPQEQEFEVFQGIESYVYHQFEMLEKAAEGSEIFIIGGNGDQFSEILGKRMFEYEKVRVSKKITVKYIGSSEQKEQFQKRGRELFEYKILPGLFTGMVNTIIWPQSLGFSLFGDPVNNFTMYNSVIAGSYRQFFETLWSLGKK